MAGTLTGLGLSQRVDLNGVPLSGWLLYIYQAFTTTPAVSYSDTGLTVSQPFPLEADSFGMMPMFWLPDGTYHALATTAGGTQTIFDVDGFLALGPSSGGGGGGSGVDPNATLLTGDFFWRPLAGARAGCIRCNGLTIGSISSGATERANADTQAGFIFLWTNFSNTDCPVSGGRGSSGLLDFLANKNIGTVDMRGCAAFGLDDMGNSAAGIIDLATTANVFLGSQSTHLTSSSQIPSHAHSAGSFAVGTAITNGTNQAVVTGGVGTSGWTSGGSGGSVTISLASGAVGGTSGSTGSGSFFDILSPGRAGTWYMRL